MGRAPLASLPMLSASIRDVLQRNDRRPGSALRTLVPLRCWPPAAVLRWARIGLDPRSKIILALRKSRETDSGSRDLRRALAGPKPPAPSPRALRNRQTVPLRRRN